jgi:hypothetical protein
MFRNAVIALTYRLLSLVEPQYFCPPVRPAVYRKCMPLLAHTRICDRQYSVAIAVLSGIVRVKSCHLSLALYIQQGHLAAVCSNSFNRNIFCTSSAGEGMYRTETADYS